jgi:putative spermidine/putrescine transport system permease protein
MTTEAPAPVPAAGLARRVATWLHARPTTRLRLLLAAPLLWLGLIYIGSLAILLMNAFWTSDSFTGKVNAFDWSLDAFAQILGNDVYRTIAIRTVGMAILVTLTDALLAFPIAYYMARVASPRVRGLLVVAVLMPLWASYLVKIFAWRTILQGNGFLAWVLSPFGIAAPGTDEIANSWLVFSYLWLPYMILPLYAGLERVPRSLLEASADLGAKARTTFRRVVLPLVVPSLVAGSIFTFSLTLGDYIVPDLVSDAKFIGNVIYDNSTLGDFPVAAAYSILPILIVVLYLVLARRLGAFESL